MEEKRNEENRFSSFLFLTFLRRKLYTTKTLHLPPTSFHFFPLFLMKNLKNTFFSISFLFFSFILYVKLKNTTLGILHYSMQVNLFRTNASKSFKKIEIFSSYFKHDWLCFLTYKTVRSIMGPSFLLFVKEHDWSCSN